MPSRNSNVDIIAIALLLLACAFFAQVRNAVRFGVHNHRIGFVSRHANTVIVVPEPPRPPLPIPFARD